MRIHRLEVKNFRHHEHLLLDLANASGSVRPLTVLVGPNMSGKTTALDAIHLAYQAVRNFRTPGGWRPFFDPSDPTLRPNPNAPIEVVLEWSLHEGEWAAMRDVETALQSQLLVADVPLYKFRLQWPPPEDTFHGVSDGLPENAQLALRGRAITSVALSRRVVSESVLDRIGGLLYLDQNRRGTIREADDRLDFAREVRPGLPMPDVIGWLARASIHHAKWDEATRGESPWSRVRRVFKTLAFPAEIDDAIPFDDGFDLRLRRGERTYFASGMSSGERQLLRFAANLAFFRATRSVILIDEVELNLHPRWQRALLRFCETGGDDDNQFIITTHSDTVLRYAERDAVVTLGALDGDQQ